jgi:hypothetical protein
MILRRPVAAALLIGAALTPATLPAVTRAAPACAAAVGPHAALVVETGSRDLRLCVALDAPSVSGTHLIELAGEQQHLVYAFGSGGEAVCRLAGVGPQGDDCFADYPDFWGYWRGDEGGQSGWTWSSTGAASTTVGDGDLEGWVWGSGDTGSTHARPPTLTIADVCTPPATPSPPAPTPGATSTHAASPSTATSGSSTSTRTPAPSRPPSGPRSARPDPGATPTPTPSVLIAAADQGPAGSSGGPGPGLALALVIGAAFAAGGWLRIRGARRRRETTAS